MQLADAYADHVEAVEREVTRAVGQGELVAASLRLNILAESKPVTALLMADRWCERAKGQPGPAGIVSLVAAMTARANLAETLFEASPLAVAMAVEDFALRTDSPLAREGWQALDDRICIAANEKARTGLTGLRAMDPFLLYGGPGSIDGDIMMGCLNAVVYDSDEDNDLIDDWRDTVDSLPLTGEAGLPAQRDFVVATQMLYEIAGSALRAPLYDAILDTLSKVEQRAEQQLPPSPGQTLLRGIMEQRRSPGGHGMAGLG